MSNQRDDTDFKREFKAKHPDLECVSFYKNSKTKVKLRCLKCGYEWFTLPHNALKCLGCPDCTPRKKRGASAIPLDEMLLRVVRKFGNLIEYISGYETMDSKCVWKCNIDGHEWISTPRALLVGSGCPICSNLRKKKKSFEKFLCRLKEIWNGLIEYVGGYENMTTKCFFRCTIHNYIWEASPNNILNGKRGCPLCGNDKIKEKLTTPLEEIIELVKLLYDDTIEYVEGYKKVGAKCKWRCKVCGYEWWACASTILQGHGCKRCADKHSGEMKTTPLEVIIEKVEKKHNHKIEYVSGYVNCNTPCLWRCRDCGYEWYDTPRAVLIRKGCPTCIKYAMERPVVVALEAKHIKYLYNKKLEGCKHNGNWVFFDFIIETNGTKLIFETDGVQHFIPIHGREVLKKQKNRDKCKDEFCKDNGYVFIRVTSSDNKEWGTNKHITLQKLLYLIEIGIDKNGNVNLDVFRPYDFNRD